MFLAAFVAYGPAVSAQGTSRPASAEAANAPRPPAELPKTLKVPTSDTVALKDEPGTYERMLLSGPDEGSMTAGKAKPLDVDKAIQWAHLSRQARWQQLRQHLGLSESDLIIWSEMVDALFGTLAALDPDSKTTDNQFGLQIAFQRRTRAASPRAR